jgi:serine protease Do
LKIDPGRTVQIAAGDLANLEQRARAAAKRALSAVVAVTKPGKKLSEGNNYQGDFASGVIVSANGIVLSQWHVSHSKGRRVIDPRESFAAGETTTVILCDGRQCPAKLLGADRSYDLSLLQLLEPGPYSYSPIHPTARVQVGDWVLKIGHPLGYRKGRAAPVRLGRVLCRTDEEFATDCMIAGGDSGGPFFNLDGELLGIVGPEPFAGFRRFQAAMTGNPLLLQRTHFPNLSQVTGVGIIDSVFSSMTHGKISPQGFRESSCVRQLMDAEQLRVEDWSQGSATLARFRPVVAPQRPGAVTVLHDGVAVALGTVVRADGWIMTKASELPMKPTCRLPNGRILQARVVGVEPVADLALLKVDADGLSPVRWAETFDPPVGAQVATVGMQDDPLAMGIISVRRRDLAGISRPTYSLPLRLPAGQPEISATQSKTGFTINWIDDLPFSAGVRIGDVLWRVAGQPFRDDRQWAEAINGLRSGDSVDLELQRRGESIKLRLPLRPRGNLENYRADDFPTVIECAVPFFSYECGGPVVDLKGRAIGITIAQLPWYGGMVIPGDCILRLLPDLKAGKYADAWTPDKSARE